MIKNLFIYGSGGFGREVKMLVDQINEHNITWNLLGFIDDDVQKKNKKIVEDFKVIGDSNFLLKYNEEADVIIAIGQPIARKNVYNKIKENLKLSFPNVIHPTSKIEKKTLKLGKGNILSTYSVISTNSSLDDFNHVHMKSLIAHDVKIGSFNNIFPGVNISGAVKIGDICDIGIGSSIRQGVIIPSNVKIGGNSFVLRNIEKNYSYLGVPVKKIFKLKEIH